MSCIQCLACSAELKMAACASRSRAASCSPARPSASSSLLAWCTAPASYSTCKAACGLCSLLHALSQSICRQTHGKAGNEPDEHTCSMAALGPEVPQPTSTGSTSTSKPALAATAASTFATSAAAQAKPDPSGIRGSSALRASPTLATPITMRSTCSRSSWLLMTCTSKEYCLYSMMGSAMEC